MKGKQRQCAGNSFTIRTHGWRYLGNDGGCIYDERTKRCEFHSISRPLTIERVRSTVCTQDISTERSCGMRGETYYYPVSSASVSPPRRASSFPISPRNGVKDFRLRFVAAFVPLGSSVGFEPTSRGFPPPLRRITRENSTLLSSPILHLTILRSSFRTNLYIFPFSYASCLFFFP